MDGRSGPGLGGAGRGGSVPPYVDTSRPPPNINAMGANNDNWREPGNYFRKKKNHHHHGWQDVRQQGNLNRQYPQNLNTGAMPSIVCGACGVAGGHDSNCSHKVKTSDESQDNQRVEVGRVVVKTRTCNNCGVEGHIARNCPKERDGKITEEATRNSVERDAVHFVRDSNQPPRNSARIPKTCRACGQEGHIKRNCPSPITIADESKTELENHLAPITVADESKKELENHLASITIADESKTVNQEIKSHGVKYQFVFVDQLAKKDELKRLVLGGDHDYKDDADKKDGFRKKKLLLVVNRRLTIECIYVQLKMSNVTAAYVHKDTNDDDRLRNLARFDYGDQQILMLMPSAVEKCTKYLEDIDWLIVLDLPSTISEYKAMVEPRTKAGRPLLVTGFYDAMIDYPLAADLLQVLREAGQTVPDWLEEEKLRMSKRASECENEE